MKLARMVCVLLSFATLTLFADDVLPDDYAAVGWIETSGTQWINTEYTALCTDRVETKIRFLQLASSTYYAVFCARGSGNANTFTCMRNNGNYFRFDRSTGTGDKGASKVVPVVGTDYQISMDANTRDCKVNGDSVATCGVPGDFTVGSSFAIFAAHSGTLDDSHVSMKSSMRLYYFRVYDKDGNLVADLEPCRRKADSKPGLYDLKNRKFLTNAGTGEFSAPLISLPEGYVKCPWVDSSGSQWVNTEYTADCTDKVETKIRFFDVSPNNYLAVFCARNNGATFTCLKNNGNVFRFDRNTGTGDHGASSFKPVAFVDYAITMDANTRDCTVNGSSVATCGTTGNFTVGSPFVLFAAHQGLQDMTFMSSMRLYYFRVLDKDGCLRADLVPCRRNSDGKVGLYDLVNDKFLVNGGTGDLRSARESVPAGYSVREWIRSTGTQYVDTGYKPSCRDKITTTFSFANASLAEYQMLYCARDSNQQNKFTFTCVLLKNGKLRFDYNDTTRGWSDVLSPRTPYLLEVNGADQTYKLDGNPVDIGQKEGAFTVGSTMYLFGSTLGTLCGSFKLYSFKITSEEGVTMCDCVPCVRDVDNVAGLYDLANDRFLENLGMGTFGVSGNGIIMVVR